VDYFIVRLGADSEREIRRIDAHREYSTSPFSIDVKCKQVPKDVQKGDFAIIWLGTNNNKGGKTPWVQGVRALGRMEGVSGSGGYDSAKTVRISVGVVLPESVTKMDIVTKQSALYPQIAAMPVLGVNNYSSQVVQRIDSAEQGQSIGALFSALEFMVPGLRTATMTAYPKLGELFDGGSPKDLQTDQTPKDQLDASKGEADADGLEADEDRGSGIEVPFDPTKIDIIAKPMTVSSLEARLQNGELDLTPDFQRQANVWDIKRKARLMESILLKIPLPSFYFSEDTEGRYAVVDGLQRLCAIFHFKKVHLLNTATGVTYSPLRLVGLQYLKELEGKIYDELDRKFQRRISELEISANIIRANTPSAVKFNVFARLNQGGIPLTAQEIRNAIFPGEWRNRIRALAESKSFVSATDGKVRTSRQQDMELALRYVALWQLGDPYRRPSNQTLDEFLNSTVEITLARWKSEKWDEATNAFHHSIDAAYKVRGRHAFRKSAGTYARNPINRGLFEAELIVFGGLSEQELAEAVAQKIKIGDGIVAALRDDEEFSRSLLYGTGSAEASNARIDGLANIVRRSIRA
jgi:hypothetical protein